MERVVITGAAGSLGKTFVKYFAKRGCEVTGIDNNEWAIAELEKEKPEGVKLLLSDCFDSPKGDLLIHCAAYKHIDLVEKNPTSSHYNNVGRTWGLFNHNGKKWKEKIFISTDKSVYPNSEYGRQKQQCEKIVSRNGGVIVRFGNILASNGSVIPLWEKAIAEGRPLPITDWEMKRYFITAEDAVERIMALYPHAKAGQVIIPEMGEEVSLREIVNKVLEKHGKPLDYPVEIIGLRPGEKLSEKLHWDHEEVVFENENGRIYDSIFSSECGKRRTESNQASS
jgi:FlaA1/EpsC-like NDP-sugar epimerase